MTPILDQKLSGYELALLYDLRKKAKGGADPVAVLVVRLAEIIGEMEAGRGSWECPEKNSGLASSGNLQKMFACLTSHVHRASLA